MNLLEALTTGDAPQPILAFSDEEYRQRFDAVRARMEAEEMELLLVTDPANQCYLAGFETVMPTTYAVLAIPIEGEVLFHLPQEDLACMTYTGWVRDIVVFGSAHPTEPTDDLVSALGERGYAPRVVGVEMAKSEVYAHGGMDAHNYFRLDQLLPDTQLRDATNLVQELRLRKSPAELAYMRRAGELSMIGVKASIETLAPGKTDNEVAAAAYSAMIAAGSEGPAIEPTLLGGPRNAWGPPHLTFECVEFGSGDAAYLEYSGSRRRYHAPAMRSVCLGEPSREARALADMSLSTLELLFEAIRPGRTGDDVARDAGRAVAARDEQTFFWGTFGYAAGLGLPPTWTEAPVYLSEGSQWQLKPGMTFHMPIWLWKVGKVAMGFSETVVVTDTGCELVTHGTGRELATR